MKPVVSAWCVERKLFKKETSLKEFIDCVKANGIEYVELLDFFWELEGPDAIKAYLDENGIKCACYSVNNNFTGTQQDREKNIKAVFDGVDLAQKLGAGMVKVFSSKPKGDFAYDDELAASIASLKECARYAKTKGVTLVLENHGLFAGTSSKAIGIIEAVGSKALRLNADTGNFLIAGEDSLQGVKNSIEFISYLHIKDVKYTSDGYPTLDGKFLEGTVIGEGDAKIKEIISYLKAVSYDGFLALEYEGIREEPYQGMLASLANFKSFIEN